MLGRQFPRADEKEIVTCAVTLQRCQCVDQDKGAALARLTRLSCLATQLCQLRVRPFVSWREKMLGALPRHKGKPRARLASSACNGERVPRGGVGWRGAPKKRRSWGGSNARTPGAPAASRLGRCRRAPEEGGGWSDAFGTGNGARWDAARASWHMVPNRLARR